jgi:GTP-binding protein
MRMRSVIYGCDIVLLQHRFSISKLFLFDSFPQVSYNRLMFFDRAKIYIRSGDGGNGVVAFRREKFVSKGGPFGGSGGRGGDVYLTVDPRLNTLANFHYKIHHRADRGEHGGGANKTGASAKDLRIPVPPGTVARNADTGELLADLTLPGQETLILQGGRGGRGNSAFKSARNKAPRIAEKGEPGRELWVTLELKLVADVGIVGVPNAGKSTLLSVVSAAKPKIADYPFTTVAPNLGVAEVNHRQMVLVDIPGLMEGAHEGVGLGLDFLRHVERTRILIHLLNGDSPDPLGDYDAINQEMLLFNPGLADKPQLVVLNKMDLPHAQDIWPTVKTAMEEKDAEVMAISAVTGEQVQQLLYRVQQMLEELPTSPGPDDAELETLPDLTPAANENAFTIHQEGEGLWRVAGVAIERTAHMTNWDYYEAGMRFQRILRAMGITDALKEAGVEDGDSVFFADVELVWGYENAFDE